MTFLKRQENQQNCKPRRRDSCKSLAPEVCNGISRHSHSGKAVKALEKEGINARLINIHTIKPIDREIVIKAAKEADERENAVCLKRQKKRNAVYKKTCRKREKCKVNKRLYRKLAVKGEVKDGFHIENRKRHKQKEEKACFVEKKLCDEN